MKIMFITPLFNGLPFLTFHYPQFIKLKLPWEWHIVEGTAMAEHGHLGVENSTDGSFEYVRSLRHDKRVVFTRHVALKDMTDAMNVPMVHVTEETLLFKLDHDEVWTTAQIETIHALFQSRPEKNHALFWCRYYIGPDIVVTTRNTWGNSSGEWPRAWRVKPGDRWASEVPPRIDGQRINAFSQDETEAHGLVMEEQATAKEARYFQKGTLDGWRRLQANTQWPCRLKDFFPWVQPETMADKLK
jgi:hypothetical protein